ncbi:hypothetical protein DQ239_15495 [Blastococcus sp. TF02-09]|uniref:protein kinase family protein n=1 Tax=Blastococcus sp. TF02-09 TaxID=2250576 RepID=UPI000DE9E265|nr:protein kinase family protein [Blastococcus sp. TF02-9]RBY75987.1 hypothetical protein DQ239_15495 [Blastococcus sp. TF02-9]
MTSTVTGLPDRYRPLDQVGPDEETETGVIQTWRAKDRILNRDVAVRVHTPAGPAAHAWITRALTAGGLATPALAMVYDASEGSVGTEGEGGTTAGAAYVVNEWIDGETLADRLADGPLPEREVRTVLRRLAEGVAEAHRVGLAVGGLTPDNVVLRPNGLVGLRGVPAASGSIDGDVAALGALLEVCLTGLRPGETEPRPLHGPSDLVALARRARSTEPGHALSSVAAMAAILAERPRSRPQANASARTEGRTDRPRPERPAADGPGTEEPVRLDRDTFPPVPPTRPGAVPPVAVGGDTVNVSTVLPAADDGAHGLSDDLYTGPPTGATDVDDDDDRARRHRLLVIALPLLALLVVVALAWWVGTSLLSVAGSVDDDSTPSISVPSSSASAPSSEAPATAGAAVPVQGAEIFNPEGDGEPENDDDVPLTVDGDPATTWSTVTYRGSPAFGNLKPGVGIVYDLGSSQQVGGVTVVTPTPGATVEVRTAESSAGSLDGFQVASSATLEGTTELVFDQPAQARYVLLWVTGLVDDSDGFSASIGEVTVQAAG